MYRECNIDYVGACEGAIRSIVPITCEPAHRRHHAHSYISSIADELSGAEVANVRTFAGNGLLPPRHFAICNTKHNV